MKAGLQREEQRRGLEHFPMTKEFRMPYPQVQKIVRASLDGNIPLMEAADQFLANLDDQASNEEVARLLHDHLVARFPNQIFTETAAPTYLKKVRPQSPQPRRRRRKSMA